MHDVKHFTKLLCVLKRKAFKAVFMRQNLREQSNAVRRMFGLIPGLLLMHI